MIAVCSAGTGLGEAFLLNGGARPPLAAVTGGVYLGGGIPPKILTKLRKGGFLPAFLAEGRFAPLLERVPVGVILNDPNRLDRRGARRGLLNRRDD